MAKKTIFTYTNNFVTPGISIEEKKAWELCERVQAPAIQTNSDKFVVSNGISV
jgi:hypothetical protein